MTKLIEKNTTIPTNAKQVFSTADDNQTAVTVHVLQGEREKASGNKSLGRFDLADIPPAPRGVPQVEVAFDIDANGILNVSATDKATGKEQSIVIKASSGLSEEEIEKMVKDAESHADEDKKFQELVNAKNQAESLIHSTEKSLEELGDKVENEEAEVVKNAIEKLKASLAKEESDVIIADTQALAEAAGKIAEKAYKAAEGDVTQPADAAEGDGDSEKQDENVVDADFEEVKNEKD